MGYIYTSIEDRLVPPSISKNKSSLYGILNNTEDYFYLMTNVVLSMCFSWRLFGMDMHFIRGEQIDRSGSSHNVKCRVTPLQGTEYRTVNLRKDNNIHFSSGRRKWLRSRWPCWFCTWLMRKRLSNLNLGTQEPILLGV